MDTKHVRCPKLQKASEQMYLQAANLQMPCGDPLPAEILQMEKLTLILWWSHFLHLFLKYGEGTGNAPLPAPLPYSRRKFIANEVLLSDSFTPAAFSIVPFWIGCDNRNIY